MKKTKIISLLTSAIMLASPIAETGSFTAIADDQQCTVTFLDFDGGVYETLRVNKGAQINYASVDTSKLHRHIDVYTEQEFSSWNKTPATTDSDIFIQALSRTAIISLESPPTKTRYYSKNGEISLKGLKVMITVYTQTPKLDAAGDYVIEESSLNVTSTCTASPKALSDVFAVGDTAKVSIYPIGQNKSIYTYDVKCYNGLGDVNGSGYVDAVDASAVLAEYAHYAAVKDYVISDEFKEKADVNMDGSVDARDASLILGLYAAVSSNKATDWDDILPESVFADK